MSRTRRAPDQLLDEADMVAHWTRPGSAYHLLRFAYHAHSCIHRIGDCDCGFNDYLRSLIRRDLAH